MASPGLIAQLKARPNSSPHYDTGTVITGGQLGGQVLQFHCVLLGQSPWATEKETEEMLSETEREELNEREGVGNRRGASYVSTHTCTERPGAKDPGSNAHFMSTQRVN